ncbi:hypothetical protein ASD87_06860 [Achromobacter sp. Root170]|nr:hypothetical protein ASD87_06860 [Achromobacter sp. Root170]
MTLRACGGRFEIGYLLAYLLGYLLGCLTPLTYIVGIARVSDTLGAHRMPDGSLRRGSDTDSKMTPVNCALMRRRSAVRLVHPLESFTP